jgi:hypothetical protein
MQKRYTTSAIWVIFDARNLGRDSVLLAFEINDTVLLLMAATAVA